MVIVNAGSGNGIGIRLYRERLGLGSLPVFVVAVAFLGVCPDCLELWENKADNGVIIMPRNTNVYVTVYSITVLFRG